MATSKRVLSQSQLAALAKGRGSGAGGRPRKVVKKAPVSVSLSPDLLDRLNVYATAHEVSRSKAVADLVDTALSDVDVGKAA